MKAIILNILWILVFAGLSCGQEIELYDSNFDIIDDASIFFMVEGIQLLQDFDKTDLTTATIKWKFTKEGCLIGKIRIKHPDGKTSFRMVGTPQGANCDKYK